MESQPDTLDLQMPAAEGAESAVFDAGKSEQTRAGIRLEVACGPIWRRADVIAS